MGLINEIIATRYRNPVPPNMNVVMDWLLYEHEYPSGVEGFSGRISGHDYSHTTFVWYPRNQAPGEIYRQLRNMEWIMRI